MREVVVEEILSWKAQSSTDGFADSPCTSRPTEKQRGTHSIRLKSTFLTDLTFHPQPRRQFLSFIFSQPLPGQHELLPMRLPGNHNASFEFSGSSMYTGTSNISRIGASYLRSKTVVSSFCFNS